MINSIRLLVVAVALGIVMPGDFAHARKGRVECDGPRRVNSWKIDFYRPNICESYYLARIAREFGMDVSARAIHNNKLLKVEVCEFVGHDYRLQNVCAGYRN